MGREQSLLLVPPSPRMLLWPEKSRSLAARLSSLAVQKCLQHPEGGWNWGQVPSLRLPVEG